MELLGVESTSKGEATVIGLVTMEATLYTFDVTLSEFLEGVTR